MMYCVYDTFMLDVWYINDLTIARTIMNVNRRYIIYDYICIAY